MESNSLFRSWCSFNLLRWALHARNIRMLFVAVYASSVLVTKPVHVEANDVEADGHTTILTNTHTELDILGDEIGIYNSNGWYERPISYYISAESFNAGEADIIRRAIRTWEYAVGKQLFVEVFEPKSEKQLSDLTAQSLINEARNSVLGFRKLRDWSVMNEVVVSSSPQSRASFITVVGFVPKSTINNKQSSGALRQHLAPYIYGGDIWYNASAYRFGDLERITDDDDGLPVADLETTTLQEIGHVLGLSHVDSLTDPKSIMIPLAELAIDHSGTYMDRDFPIISRVPSLGDVLRLQKIYGCVGDACQAADNLEVIRVLRN